MQATWQDMIGKRKDGIIPTSNLTIILKNK